MDISPNGEEMNLSIYDAHKYIIYGGISKWSYRGGLENPRNAIHSVPSKILVI